MSDGPRIPLAAAQRAAVTLIDRWGLSTLDRKATSQIEVVGSVRRLRHEVGDLELVAPLPAGWRSKNLTPTQDDLFMRINGSMQNPWSDPAAPLFTPAGDSVAVESAVGRAVRGLKPGFLACSLMLTPWDGIDLPCQVYRCTPHNHGWMMIERTGPTEFGRWFLWRWKVRFGIPLGDPLRPASVQNHLVDTVGRLVDVPTEAEAFRLVGERYIPPHERDEFMARQQASREALR
ncbi:MAG: hypothetical protein IPK69_11775 [Phycisphaerales bacterium]|nr:MAG: hypothetical protein IPK69_11775 [Phycisphaerales bacterium]